MESKERSAELASISSFIRSPRLILAISVLFGAAAIGFVVLTLRGVTARWNPIPFWDMWNGDIAFWYRLQDGAGPIAFWEQHNEHRIVLAKVFFWFDMQWFHGNGVLLIVSILVSLALVAVTLVCSLKHRLQERRGHRHPVSGFIVVSSLVVVIQVSWMQWENLVWGFQIQFVLATLLPLVALVCGARSQVQGVSHGRSRWFFAAALVAGLGSLFTMANGLVVPWVLAVLLLVIGAGRARIVTAGTLALVSTVVYLIGYTHSSDEEPSHDPLLTRLVEGVRYLLSYIGAPWLHATQSSWLAVLGGVFVIGATVVLTIKLILGRRANPMGLALVAFAWFLIGSGVLTTIGRSYLGVEQGLSSRYQTPVLALWAALLVVAAPSIVSYFERRPYRVLVASGLVVAVLVPQQLQARSDFADEQAGRSLATISLALGILDDHAIRAIHFDPGYVVPLAERLRVDGLTVLGSYPFVNAERSIGFPLAGTPTEITCEGAVSYTEEIDGSAFVKFVGWIRPPAQLVAVGPVVDGRGRVNGYVAYGTALSETDVAVAGVDTTFVGFTGYIARDSDLDQLFLSTGASVCVTPLTNNIVGAEK